MGRRRIVQDSGFGSFGFQNQGKEKNHDFGVGGIRKSHSNKNENTLGLALASKEEKIIHRVVSLCATISYYPEMGPGE